MGFKVDDVFVDFFINFEKGEQGARRINEQMARLGKVSGVAADAQDRVARATNRARDAQGKYTSGVKKGTKAVKSNTAELKRMIKTLIGLEVARRVVRALLNTFVSFRTAMNNVMAITNATDAQFSRLKATAMELGRTTQFTATNAAEAMAFLARTGLDVNQTIAVLPGTLNLAAATAVDLATAADLSTNILKGMGMEISELDGLVDVLAKTTNSSNVDIRELGEAMKEVAPIAKSAGMGVKETAALIGILGDSAIKGGRAGTALRRMLINLTTGAEGAQAVIDRLGLQIFDASGEFVGITSVMGQLNEKNADAADMFKLFGARGLAAANVLRRSGAPAIEAFTKALDKAGGTAERMAKQQMAGLVGELKLLQSQTEASSIAWGDALEPALIAGSMALRGILWFVNGVLAAFKLVGPAVFVMGEAVISGTRIAADAVGVALGAIIEKLGTFVRFVGELGEKFGVLPGLSETLANFGLGMERTGTRFRRAAAADMKIGIDDIKFAWQGAAMVMDDVANEMMGTTDAAGEAAGALKGVAAATDETVAALQRARTALNLDVFTAQLAAVRDLLRETFGVEGEGALGLQARLEMQRRLLGMNEKQVEGVMDLLAAEQDLAAAVEDVLAIQEKLNAAGEDQEKIAKLTKELEQAVSALAAATLDADAAMEGLGKSGKGVGEVLTKIALAVRGITRIADAFGIVNDDVRRALDSVLDLINAFSALKAAKGAMDLGTMLGLAGGAIGAISAIGGLFGGKIRPRSGASRSGSTCCGPTTSRSRSCASRSRSRSRCWASSPAPSSRARRT